MDDNQVLLDILKTKPEINWKNFTLYIYFYEYTITLEWKSSGGIIYRVNGFEQRSKISNEVYNEYKEYGRTLLNNLDVKNYLRNKKLNNILKEDNET